MDIRLSSEQLQLQDSVAKFLAAEYPFDARLRAGHTDLGWSEGVWSGLVSLGLNSITVPEDQGGFGGGASDLLPVMFEIGRSLVIEPFFATGVWSTGLLTALPAGARRDELLAGLAEGVAVVTCALPRQRGWALQADQGAGAEGTWTLRGEVQQVVHGMGAHTVLAAARVEGGAIGLFAVDAAAGGLRRRGYRLPDQTAAADLSFDGASAVLLALGDDAQRAIEHADRLATAALCAEMAGAAQGAFDATVAYVKTRTQFGRALSENQVVRHMGADMLVWNELCASLAYLAAVAVDAPDSVDAATDLARAKLLVGRYGRQVCECAVQLHGGVAITDEYIVGHYLQRIVRCDAMLGDQDAQLDALLGASA